MLSKIFHPCTILSFLCLVPFPLPAETSPDELPARYREWLEQVELLITDEEREYFLRLEENFRRNAFIEAFWKERDTYKDTAFVELKVHWDERTTQARSRWQRLDDARAQVFIVQGEPYSICWHKTREIEVWIYDEGPKDAVLRSYDSLYPVLLYQSLGEEVYRRWSPFNLSMIAKSRGRLPDVPLIDMCDDAAVMGAQQRITADERDPRTEMSLEIPEPSKEWVASFASETTDLPEGAAIFDTELTFDFPGRHQQRTVTQGVLRVDRGAVSAFGGANKTHQFLLIGELLRGEEIFDTFRYRFEMAAEDTSHDPLHLVFQRYLRPGEFRLLLKLEDLFGHRFARLDRRLEVPSRESEVDVSGPNLEDSELFRFLEEANAATARGERSLRLISPPGVVQTGMVRFKTLAVGAFDRVDFLLDGETILSKKREPYSVELDLGELPEMHRLRATGFDEAGQQLATDELILNPGGQRFRVHLTEPQSGRSYRRSLRTAVQVIAPESKKVDRVEIYLNEDRVATLYQPPYTQPVLLEGEELTYVRAVAYLTDGNASEDMVFINAPGGNIEEIHVHFVELYATVHDKGGRLIPGLFAEDFKVYEDGALQEARRFLWVDDLPLHSVLLIDTSASMEDSLDQVGEAALTFVDQAIEAKDRASLIAFHHLPALVSRFSNDKDVLKGHLKAMRASGGTSLYDSLVFALHYFDGVKGQRALLLLSDGKDESSDFSFESTLEFARRAGVQIYAIALKESDLDKKSRRVLRQLATETGGRVFFVERLDELPGIYGSIEKELRSQYLFAYQSSSDKDPSEFRRIEVTVMVDGRRAEVRTMSGYYP